MINLIRNDCMALYNILKYSLSTSLYLTVPNHKTKLICKFFYNKIPNRFTLDMFILYHLINNCNYCIQKIYYTSTINKRNTCLLLLLIKFLYSTCNEKKILNIFINVRKNYNKIVNLIKCLLLRYRSLAFLFIKIIFFSFFKASPGLLRLFYTETYRVFYNLCYKNNTYITIHRYIIAWKSSTFSATTKKINMRSKIIMDSYIFFLLILLERGMVAHRSPISLKL
uniref:Uncharacterized protein n=1 Tax=Amorphochlora amoebiformis TaxID=1561963 RepID=A0A0H5BKN5_9EUKA|nr:hypothetical protein [Amorphochlora amoebiformis]